VIAFNSAGKSDPSPIVQAALQVAGPDIGKNLMAIASDVVLKVSQITQPDQKLALLKGAAGLGFANYWDISRFQLLPNTVAGTCTVNGQIFDTYAVNYWLGGLLYNELVSAGQLKTAKAFYGLMLGYTPVAMIISGMVNGTMDDRSEKIAWFEAGIAADTSLPQQPERFDDLIPGKPMAGKLHWHIGWLSGGD
jgi:hypothetical protein